MEKNVRHNPVKTLDKVGSDQIFKCCDIRSVREYCHHNLLTEMDGF